MNVVCFIFFFKLNCLANIISHVLSGTCISRQILTTCSLWSNLRRMVDLFSSFNIWSSLIAVFFHKPTFHIFFCGHDFLFFSFSFYEKRKYLYCLITHLHFWLLMMCLHITFDASNMLQSINTTFVNCSYRRHIILFNISWASLLF